ncbi:MAG: TlpA disulfide reductase family protein [Acidobacteriota bacterium]|jgi:peroxiredoxin
MTLRRRAFRRILVLACLPAALLCAVAAAQSSDSIAGYGPWTFGMRRFQVASFREFGPYLPVESTGGLETRNGEFEGEVTNTSFVFDDDGLRYIQIWAYEGNEIDDMMRALHRVYVHMSERYGDLMMESTKLPPGLNLEELADLIPDEYLQPLSRPTEQQTQVMDRRRIQQSIRNIDFEPVWQPEGARIVGQIGRIEVLGGTNVMLYYRRGADWRPAERVAAAEAETGPAEVVDVGAYISATLEPAERYALRAADSALLARYPELGNDPDAYVVSMPLGQARSVVALVGNYDDGFELRILPPAVAEPSELPFTREDDRYVLDFEATARAREGDGVRTWPVALRFAIHEDDEPGKMRVIPIAMRRGVVTLDERTVEFAVSGDGGVFNDRVDSVFFDIDGNGEFDQRQNSPERYQVIDGYFTLDGTNWEFVVDHYGDRVSFFPLDDSYPERIALNEGAPAPDFEFVDLQGVSRRLSDYRGEVVLLDFWGAWCGPCHAEAPHLVEAYERFAARGFEIIGIDYGDDEEQQRAFMEEFGIDWPQTRESNAARPIHELYRVPDWPTHFLIDEDGMILKYEPRGEQLIELLEEHFGG